jgi:hypothetical protein
MEFSEGTAARRIPVPPPRDARPRHGATCSQSEPCCGRGVARYEPGNDAGVTMARKPKSTSSDVKLPPSLSPPTRAPSPDETEAERLQRQCHNAQTERRRELKKKRDFRKRKVEAAMRSLPLTGKAKSQVSAFVSAFEATYYNPGNGLTAAMRDTAAFAYSKLTGKPIELGSFEQFLEAIFRAYEIKADLQHRTGLG